MSKLPTGQADGRLPEGARPVKGSGGPPDCLMHQAMRMAPADCRSVTDASGRLRGLV
jgi:hypothetical protein